MSISSKTTARLATLAGYSVGSKTRKRILELSKLSQLELSDNHLTRRCSGKDLGTVLQEFAEAAKTIGDAYLAYTSRPESRENEELKDKIRETLLSRHFVYKERQILIGEIVGHRVDFYVPPNGTPALAVAVLLGPDKIHAEAWGFKARDIKAGVPTAKLFIGVVYDATAIKRAIRNIIESTADIPLPSNELDSFGQRLDALRLTPNTRQEIRR